MKISVIIPAYNESKIIAENAEKTNDFLAENFEDYELLITDDGSLDDTFQIATSFAESHPNVQIITHPFNRGKGAAVKEGVLAATGDFILFLDADLPYSLQLITDIVKELNNDNDIVIGTRYSNYESNAKHGKIRYFLSRFFIKYVNFMLKTKFSDVQAGIKGFKNSVAKQLFSSLSTFGFGFDAEILAKAKEQNLKIHELPVEVTNPRNGTKVRIIKDSFIMFWNVVQIKWSLE